MYRDGTLPRLRNVQGWNISKVEECTGKGEIQFYGQSDTHTDSHTDRLTFALLELLLCS